MDAAVRLCSSLLNEGRSKTQRIKGKLEIFRQKIGEAMQVLTPDGVNKRVVIYLKRIDRIQYAGEI
jgi:hypothetical protein